MQCIYCRHCMNVSGRDGLQISRVALDMVSEQSTWSDLSALKLDSQNFGRKTRGEEATCVA